MKAIVRAALPVALPLCAVVSAIPALAQDEGTPPVGDPALLEAPGGILGPHFPENQERQAALLLQNFIAMDLNGDFLLARHEWDVWSGWRDLSPPDFATVDANSSTYLGYREYEDAAIGMGDTRMADAMHGAVFPAEGVAE